MFTVEKTVSQNDTAAYFGSGLLNVFATPAMIALMENSAHLLANSFLSLEEDTVGIEISVNHTRATPLGAKVKAQATLTATDGKKLIFNIKAFDEQGQIGYGTHVRYIINPVKFMERIS